MITPDFEGAKKIAQAGATIIALDATFYPSEIKEDTQTLVDRIHSELGLMVMADISTVEEAVAAAKLGVDAVSTTLAGYVPGALHTDNELYRPNFKLIEDIAKQKLPVTLVAEGRFWNPWDLEKAYEIGADAVVIGKAITNPMAITKYFLTATKKEAK